MRLPSRKTVLRIVPAFLLALVLAFAVTYGFHHYQYPYGRTHRCTRMMWFALQHYAEAHEGKFPAGEATPEASLSLLYRTNDVPADFLAGRAKSPEVAKKILESGELLDPDTCDWHYVEGLTWDDDYRLALVWDKSSLGHTGYRLHGGHEVMRIGMGIEVIRADKWEEFLAEQAEIMAQRSSWAKEGRPVLTARVQMPDGTLIDYPDQGVDLSYESRYPDGTRGGGSSYGGGLAYASRLCWYYPHADNGTTRYQLDFSGLRSEPLTVEWRNGLPDRPTIIFRMRGPKAPRAAEGKEDAE